MTWLLTIDAAISSRLCFTLLHSLWQVALFLLIAEGITRLLPRPSAQNRYVALALALFLSLLALPVTYGLLGPSMGPLPTDASSSNTATPPADEAISDAPLAVAPASSTVGTSPHNQLQESNGGAFSHWTSWLLGFYVVGVGLMLIRFAFGFTQNRRDRQRLQWVSSGQAHVQLQRLCSRLHVSNVPLLAHADHVAIPKLVGLIRPVIVVPSAALTGFTTKEMEMILAHELSHLRRGDMWLHLVQRVAESVLFFNPAIWVLSRRINRLREFCCDDVAYSVSECHPSVYAQLLVRLAESAVGHCRHRELTALASTGNGPSELRRRVARLLGEPVRSPLPFTRRNMLVASALTLLICGSMVWPSHGQTSASAADGEGRPSGSMTREFKSGTVVELLGIGTHDRNAPSWWDDHGRTLENLKVTWDDSSGSNAASQQPMKRTVAIRVHGRPEDSYLTWRLPGSASWVGVNAPDDTFARHFSTQKEDAKTIDVKVGIASGAWELAGSGSASHGAAAGRSGHSMVISRGFEADGGAAVIVSHDYFDEDFRIVAVDIQGAMHPQQGRGGVSAGPIYQCQATFPGLSLDQIDRFEFHTRDYEWVEFKNLPLQPE